MIVYVILFLLAAVLLAVLLQVVIGPVIGVILTDIEMALRQRFGRRGGTTGKLPDAAERQTPPASVDIGAEGKTITPLKPFGLVQINDQRHPAKSDLGFIAAGQSVRVVSQDHTTLIVRDAAVPPR